MEAAAPSHGLILDHIPTDVLFQILAFTSSPDAARSSAVSKNFRRAAASDAVWDRFLPPDIDAILSRAVAPYEFHSKKDLFLRLSPSAILIDGGDASFALERSSGKTCLMLSARKLRIPLGNDARYWTCIPDPESTFVEVAELRGVWWLDLHGAIETTSLSPRATYGAFMVCRRRERRSASELRRRKPLWLCNGLTIDFEEVRTPRSREDGWMEIEMGRFLNDHEEGSIVLVRFHQVLENYKTGLIVQGLSSRNEVKQVLELGKKKNCESATIEQSYIFIMLIPVLKPSSYLAQARN